MHHGWCELGAALVLEHVLGAAGGPGATRSYQERTSEEDSDSDISEDLWRTPRTHSHPQMHELLFRKIVETLRDEAAGVSSVRGVPDRRAELPRPLGPPTFSPGRLSLFCTFSNSPWTSPGHSAQMNANRRTSDITPEDLPLSPAEQTLSLCAPIFLSHCDLFSGLKADLLRRVAASGTSCASRTRHADQEIAFHQRAIEDRILTTPRSTSAPAPADFAGRLRRQTSPADFAAILLAKRSPGSSRRNWWGFGVVPGRF